MGALMYEFVRELDEATRGETVLVATGVGSHQSIVAREFTFCWPDRVLLTSAGHGTMGSGLGYLVGAWLAQPTYLPILVTGDGSWDVGDCLAWKTVAEKQIPVKAFVLDNGCFGIVRQFEELQGMPHVATVHRRLTGLFTGIQEALSANRPVLSRVQVDDYGVWPILEGGRPLTEMTEKP